MPNRYCAGKAQPPSYGCVHFMPKRVKPTQKRDREGGRRAVAAVEPDQRTLHRTRSEPAILSALQSRRAFVEGAELPAAAGLQISQERQRRYHRLERGD